MLILMNRCLRKVCLQYDRSIAWTKFPQTRFPFPLSVNVIWETLPQLMLVLLLFSFFHFKLCKILSYPNPIVIAWQNNQV